MSAIDNFLAAQPASASAGAAPQNVEQLLAQEQATQAGTAPAAAASAAPPAVPPALAAPQVPQAAQPGMLASFGAGLGHGVQQGVLGAQQLLGKGLTALGANNVGPWLTNDANTGIARGNAQYAPYQQANPITAGAGNLIGQGAAAAPTMAVGPEYAGLSLAGRLGLGAAQGAAGAAMTPVAPNASNYWQQKAMQTGLGAGLGAAVPVALAGGRAIAGNVAGALRPVLQPGRFVGSGLTGAMTPQEAAAAAANIRGAQTFVPGSVPTTAQVAGNPMLVQTEKALANQSQDFKTALMQNGIANNDARWTALNSVAQDPQALAAAQAARSQAAQPLYDAAHQATANVGPAFMRYAQIPEMQQAMQAAQQNAALDASVGRGIPPVWPTPNSNTINGSALDYTSRSLGDMIQTAQQAGQTSRAGSLAALKSNVDSWTQRYVPGVQAAKDAYAQGSVPINTMGVGQQIANNLGTRAMNAAQVPQINLMPYRSALTQAMNSGDAATYGIDANALNTLQGIGQDLQRESVSNSVKTGGSDTAYNLAANGWLARNLYGPNFEGATNIGKGAAALGALMSGHPIAAGGVIAGGNRLGKMVGGLLQNQLGGYLTNPNSLLPYLDSRAAAAAQPIPNALMQGLSQYGRPAAINAATQFLPQGNSK